MPLTARSLILPSRGKLLVNTDLHGNLADFTRLESIFLQALDRGEEVQWAILGDLVHGPSPDDAEREPWLYGYPDESARLIERLIAVRAQHPGRVHVVLGNHDHGHVGGKATAKFHEDEVEFLEAPLDSTALARLRGLFEEALLIIAAPCGALLSHGSPGEEVASLKMLDGPLTHSQDDPDRWRAMQSILWSYGQSSSTTAALLNRLGREVSFPLRFVVHGHDRDEQGLILEGDNQIQPVLFGALQEYKRYLWLDLETRYSALAELREGLEIRLLY